jgi:hypothetical protein
MPTATDSESNRSMNPASMSDLRKLSRTKEFNLALLHICNGRGSVVSHLATATGLSVDGIKSRVKRARFDYTDEDRDGPTNVLSSSEARYMSRAYRSSSDPAIQEFLSQLTVCSRVRPDFRGQHDPDARPVGKSRRARVPA